MRATTLQSWEHQNGDLAASQVLLILDILVCREQYLEAGRLRGIQQITVRDLVQPRSRASTTVCPTSAGAMPLGVPWSKRTSIVGRGRRDLNRWRIQAASCKFEHSPDLFRRHMELLNDFLDAGARFEILEDRRHGHPCTSKNPCTAAPARHAFHYLTLRPVKCCHRESPFVILAHGCVSPSGAGRSPLDSQRARTFPAVGHLSARKPHRGEHGGSSGPGPGRPPRRGVPHPPDSSGMLAGRSAYSVRRSGQGRSARRSPPSALLSRPTRWWAQSPDMVGRVYCST